MALLAMIRLGSLGLGMALLAVTRRLDSLGPGTALLAVTRRLDYLGLGTGIYIYMYVRKQQTEQR